MKCLLTVCILLMGAAIAQATECPGGVCRMRARSVSVERVKVERVRVKPVRRVAVPVRVLKLCCRR